MRLPKFLQMRSPVSAGASVNDVQRAFQEQIAVGDQYWWWIRAMFIDPNEIIVDDGDDNLYRLSYSINGSSVEFGDPQKVEIHYVDISDKAAAKAEAVKAMGTVREPEQIAASFTSREESRPTDSKEGGKVTVAELRTKLGLPDDTSDEDVLAAAAERLVAQETTDEPETPPAPAPPQPSPVVTPEVPKETPAGEPPPADLPEEEQRAAAKAAQERSGVVLVDAATLQELQRKANQGAEAREAQIEKENLEIVEKAIASGKFPPARKKHWIEYLRVDRDGGIEAIEGLMENIIPVKERNISEAEELANTPGYPETWLPDVAERKRRLSAGGRRSRVSTEVG